MPSRLVSVAIDIAQQAGRYLKENLEKKREIKYKGKINLVTEMDRAAEELIITRLTKATPQYGVLTEERGEVGEHQGERWIVDPLDGTTNYAHRFPFFCVSIALEIKRQIILGVVYDPLREELFVASRGEGAYLNQKRVHVSETADLRRSLLATGFSYRVKETRSNLDHFEHFILRAQAVRRAGSAALDMCYVACGRFDGFWELDLYPWDTAAAGLIVTEAGGRMSTFAGSPYNIYQKEILASNGKIHPLMVEVLSHPNPS